MLCEEEVVRCARARVRHTNSCGQIPKDCAKRALILMLAAHSLFSKGFVGFERET